MSPVDLFQPTGIPSPDTSRSTGVAEQMCLLEAMPTNENMPFLLGDTFLRKVVAVFDGKNKRVGLARRGGGGNAASEAVRNNAQEKEDLMLSPMVAFPPVDLAETDYHVDVDQQKDEEGTTLAARKSSTSSERFTTAKVLFPLVANPVLFYSGVLAFACFGASLIQSLLRRPEHSDAIFVAVQAGSTPYTQMH